MSTASLDDIERLNHELDSLQGQFVDAAALLTSLQTARDKFADLAQTYEVLQQNLAVVKREREQNREAAQVALHELKAAEAMTIEVTAGLQQQFGEQLAAFTQQRGELQEQLTQGLLAAQRRYEQEAYDLRQHVDAQTVQLCSALDTALREMTARATTSESALREELAALEQRHQQGMKELQVASVERERRDKQQALAHEQAFQQQRTVLEQQIHAGQEKAQQAMEALYRRVSEQQAGQGQNLREAIAAESQQRTVQVEQLAASLGAQTQEWHVAQERQLSSYVATTQEQLDQMQQRIGRDEEALSGLRRMTTLLVALLVLLLLASGGFAAWVVFATPL